MLTQGDCLDVLPTLEAGSVDLIYADPPFNSGRNYAGAAGEFRDTWPSMDAYLDFMRARVAAMRRVLSLGALSPSARGSVWLAHDDFQSACSKHRLRCVLDAGCGRRADRIDVTRTK